MTRIASVLAAVLLATGLSTVLAQDAGRAETMFANAQHKDVTEGDLKAAIALYRQVVAQSGSNRPLAARALLATAEAYRKLGDPQARGVFEEVLQKYPDQAAPASAARARLGLTPPAGAAQALTTQRVLATGDGDRVSPDGRFLVRGDTNLALYEISTGNVREVTTDGNPDESDHKYPLAAVFAPDGQRLAYALYIEKENRSILRIVSISGARSTTLYDNTEVTDIIPTDWSPDGRWISVSISRPDRTRQVGLVRVEDGSVHILRSIEWIGASHMAFSPDSRYLAYDRPAAEGETERDVFVIAVNATRELPAVVNPGDDRIVGWAPDGSRLLFSSDRGGTVGLWAVTMREGQPGSTAEFLSDFGMGRPIGMTASGALYYKVLLSGADIWVASFDRQTGQLSSTPARLVRQFKGLNLMPEWSADGQYLAYVSKRDPMVPSPVAIVISAAGTGDVVRELHPKLSYLLYPRWSSDGRTFIARGNDLKGRSGIVRIDAMTGAASLVVPNETCSGVPYWAAEGRTFYCVDSSKGLVVEVDVDSGAVRRTFQANQGNASPDGRHLVFSAGGALNLLALAGGASRQILRYTNDTRPWNLLTLTFTPDSQHVVFGGRVRGTQGIWRIGVDGGEPQRIAVEAPSITQWRFNPKTWQVAFAPSNAPRFEIRKMEHFLPSARPAPRR